MNLGKLGQAITGKEIFDLIHDDLERVEKEISLETVASVDVGHPDRPVSAGERRQAAAAVAAAAGGRS